VYRFRQFFSAATACIGDKKEKELDHLLTPTQRDLFRQMPLNDQRHSMSVWTTLRKAGIDDSDLLVAALLHDVGKAAGRIWLWQRTLIVLLERWAPAGLTWLERGPDYRTVPRWRRGFVINRIHPELGARWAAEAGGSPLTVSLIRHHQEPVYSIENNQDRLLAALQWADGVN
jgi:hypothetical protein